VDLKNRLQGAVNFSAVESNLQFERLKFTIYRSQELHVAGPDLEKTV
jgi:hypothetical protein